MQLKGIIFDLDGTIVDSRLNFDLMREEIGIPKGEPILEYLEAVKDDTFIKKAYEIVHKHELKGAQESTLIRDFLDFYNFLNNHNVPKAVLTRNSKEIANMTLNKHDLEFEVVLSRDCCEPKPKPDGLNLINSKWKFDTQEIIYVGDFKFDLETAKNAHMKSALILNELNHHFADDADISINLFNELKRYFKKIQ